MGANGHSNSHLFVMHGLWRRLFLSLVVAGITFARTYNQIDSISGHDFLDAFEVKAIPDPTHGRV